MWCHIVQLTSIQKAVLEMHDDLDTLAKADNIKGKRYTKVSCQACSYCNHQNDQLILLMLMLVMLVGYIVKNLSFVSTCSK